MRARLAYTPQPMQFLKTLFWVLLTAVVVFFCVKNWTDVTINLWGDIQADTKIPVLLLVFFLLGFLPTWLIQRARIWSMRRRLEAFDRQRVPTVPVEPEAEDESPVL